MKGYRDDEDSIFQVIEELTHGFMADLLFFLVFPLCHLSRFMLQKYIISWKRANKWGKNNVARQVSPTDYFTSSGQGQGFPVVRNVGR